MAVADLPVQERALERCVVRRRRRAFDPSQIGYKRQLKHQIGNRYALRTSPQTTRVTFLLRTACKVHGVDMADLRGKTSTMKVAAARHHAMWLLRHHAAMSLPAIGAIFGYDHSTVVYGVNRWQQLLDAQCRPFRTRSAARCSAATNGRPGAMGRTAKTHQLASGCAALRSTAPGRLGSSKLGPRAQSARPKQRCLPPNRPQPRACLMIGDRRHDQRDRHAITQGRL